MESKRNGVKHICIVEEDVCLSVVTSLLKEVELIGQLHSVSFN